MSPFMIFALVLTIAYLIYYGVIIARDLQGKKGRTASTEEVFDLEGMESEEPVEVRETGGSFHIGGTDTSKETVEADEPESDAPDETHRDAAEEKAEQVKSALVEAEVECEGGMFAPALHELLEGKRQSLFKPEMTITRNEI